jgi:hypothetical protein
VVQGHGRFTNPLRQNLVLHPCFPRWTPEGAVRDLDFLHLPGSVILSHQAKDLAAAIFAAVICPPPRCSADQTKSLSAQRASRDPSPAAQMTVIACQDSRPRRAAPSQQLKLPSKKPNHDLRRPPLPGNPGIKTPPRRLKLVSAGQAQRSPLRDGRTDMSLLTKLRKSPSSVLHASLVIGLIISTTPILDGCSRGTEAPSAPSEQPSSAAAPPAAQESAPAAAQSPPAPPAEAPPPGAAAVPPAPSGEAAAPPGSPAAPPAAAPALATPQQLQQLVSPIALYPDSLVAQILAGSTFPTQIVEAERFVQQNPNLTGDALAAQVNANPWDPSVRSLCQFPSVLGTMNQNLSWTTALGQAYYTQPQDVLAAVQVMRHRAMQAGTLKSTTQQRVVVERVQSSGPVVMQEGGGPPQVIVIQPAQPNVVYVPTYNPQTVYGQPVPPPPGYSGSEMLMAGVVAGVVGFGAGMLTSSLINNGNNNWGTNWGGGNVVYNRNVYVSNSNYFVNRYPQGYPPSYPGYRPGYPGYPNRPGYPGYANQPGYPGYPANRPGYPANRPGYPAGYPPRPVPYAGNRPNLAATNPNFKPNMPKSGMPPNRPGYPAGYPPRPAPYKGKSNLAATNPNLKHNIPKPGTGNKPYPGSKSGGNFPSGSHGAYKPGWSGKPGGANLAETKPSKPMTKPANNLMRGNSGAGGGNRRGPTGFPGGSKPGGSSPGNSFKGRPGGRNIGAAGGAKGAGTAGRGRRVPGGG